jgi:predicted lipoprotein with Yx(FWY)xxD motif
LVDANGRTLYLFEGDRRNHSTLSRAGFAVWPAFTSAGTPQAKNGVSAPHIAVIKSHGKRQVTYYGHPLYYYVGDKTSGETHGQGLKEFGALWYVLSPTGTAFTSVPSGPATTTTESPDVGPAHRVQHLVLGRRSGPVDLDIAQLSMIGRASRARSPQPQAAAPRARRSKRSAPGS